MGATEPPAFFDPLAPTFRLAFASDYPAELTNISSNYALYAVESLVFFGAASMVETVDDTWHGLKSACFPASLAVAAGGHEETREATRASRAAAETRPGSGGLRLRCASPDGVLASGVFYGRACLDNPPCGRMSFINHGAAGTLPAAPTGCGPLRTTLGTAGLRGGGAESARPPRSRSSGSRSDAAGGARSRPSRPRHRSGPAAVGSTLRGGAGPGPGAGRPGPCPWRARAVFISCRFSH